MHGSGSAASGIVRGWLSCHAQVPNISGGGLLPGRCDDNVPDNASTLRGVCRSRVDVVGQ